MATGSTGSAGSSPKSATTNIYNVYCKASKLLPGISQMNSSMGNISESMALMNDSLNSMYETLQEILEIQKHVHDSHWHPMTHYAEQGTTGVEPGSLFVPYQPDEINLLMQESQSGLDKDNNNLVYLKDFIIDDNDSEKPPVLRDVEMHFRYDGITLPSKSMTWANYLKTLPWCTT